MKYLNENNIPNNEMSVNYKKYLKNLKSKCLSAKFTKSNRSREPEIICSMSTIADTLDNYIEDKEDFVKSL